MMHKEVYYDSLSPVKFLPRAASVFGEKTAVVNGDKKYSYAEFYDRVNRFANALTTAGIGKGDKVAFISPNIPPLLEAHYAVLGIGAVLVSINIRLSAREVSYILNHSDSKILFVDTEFSGLVKPILDELPGVKNIVDICDVSDQKVFGKVDYEEFIASGDPEPFAMKVDDEMQLACINYTSGTTGLPKGVMYHHRGAFLNALGEALEFHLDSNSNYLWTLPMFHCNGWCFTWAVTAVGGTHVCLRQVEAGEIYRLIEKENISHLCAAPTVLIMMSTHPKAKTVKMKRQLEIMTAGAPPAPTVIKNMEGMGANITQTYGLTEVFGPHSVCEWQSKWDNLSDEDRAGIKARQGVAYVHALHMDVVDPLSMEPVTRDGKCMGEIVMRGNNVMMGYYKDTQATDTAFTGGWFHSGDLAVVHPDNYIQIMDRKKDIIISGGENISTVEIEAAIYRHPAVSEVAVIPVPHPKWGEVPKAFIKLKDGKETTSEEIIEFCRDQLARFKVPKHVAFGDLPKTGTGKIMKYKLREAEWKGQKRKVN